MGSPSGEPCPEGYPGTGCPASGTTTEEPGRGTAETLHYVRLTHAFEVQAREVTQAEWESAFGSNPSWAGPNGAAPACGPDCPVERVSWLDALAYANRLSTAAGLVPCYLLEDCTDDLPGAGCAHDAILCSDPRGCTVTLNGVATPYECQGYRLPTEAEWEYAYRSGSVTALYPTDGNDGSLTQPNDTPVDPNLAQVGWYTANAGDGAHPGGTLEPNAWGLADMAGNVWEWCWGGYTGYPSGTLSSPAIDPVSDPWSTTVARGGAYSDWASYARAAFRGTFGIDLRAGKVGFRLVRTL